MIMDIYVSQFKIFVLIYDGVKYIIVENKVNHACDQDRQLVRYIDPLSDKDVYVLYLVRFENDKDPSENSLPAERRQELKENGNPHAHIMLTTRGIDLNGKWEQKG